MADDKGAIPPLDRPTGGEVFVLVCECLGRNGVPDRPGHLYFAPAPGAVVPPKLAALKSSVEETALTLREVFAQGAPERFREYFEELLSLAQVGLVGPNPSPEPAADALATLRTRVTALQGPKIKRAYLNNLGKLVLLASAMFVGLALALEFWGPLIIGVPAVPPPSATAGVAPFWQSQPPGTYRLSYYAVLLAAAMGGTWLSFALRKPRLSFDDLLNPSEDMLSPVHRLIAVSGAALFLCLLCGANMVGVSVGTFSTDRIGSQLLSALILGVACGFSEQLLSSTVLPHANRLMERLREPKEAGKA